MKILLATDEYLPHPGGVSRVILETVGRLRTRGHHVDILTFERNPNLPREDKVADVLVHRVPLRGKLSTYPRALFGSQRIFRELVRDGQYDLLHIHLPLIGGRVLLSGEVGQIPRAYTYHGPWHLEMGTELRAKLLCLPVRMLYHMYVRLLCWGLKWWQSQVMSRCDRVIVLSEHSRQQIVTLFPSVARERVVLIPGGVDIERFRPATNQADVRAQLSLPRDRTIILTVRRLVPRMGLENLLKAFAQLSRQRSDLHLVIGGSGQMEKSLRASASQLSVADRVQFVGFISEDDLPAYYQAADLFVLPTVALEGFGLITLEALASGLSVVGTPVGGTPEILGRFDARFLTSGAEVEALVEGLRRGLSIARQEGVTLSKRCRAFAVTYYDWEDVVDRYELLYSELLEKARDT